MSFCLSTIIPSASKINLVSPSRYSPSTGGGVVSVRFRCSLVFTPISIRHKRRRKSVKNHFHVICMAPDEEKLTQRNPLEFPVEWERPKPGRRPDIFPKFSPMKTPLPPPLPADPPDEDEEEEDEEKKKKEEEEEGDEEKEDDEESDKPEKEV